jgi:hypothetical protein
VASSHPEPAAQFGKLARIVIMGARRIVDCNAAVLWIVGLLALAGCPSAKPPTVVFQKPAGGEDERQAEDVEPVATPDNSHETDDDESPEQIDERARAALAKAIDFLMRQQGEDGAFKSTTYGMLKQGPATTSLALYAMGHVDEDKLVAPHREALHRAYMFLRPGLEKTGQIAAPDGTLD